MQMQNVASNSSKKSKLLGWRGAGIGQGRAVGGNQGRRGSGGRDRGDPGVGD